MQLTVMLWSKFLVIISTFITNHSWWLNDLLLLISLRELSAIKQNTFQYKKVHIESLLSNARNCLIFKIVLKSRKIIECHIYFKPKNASHATKNFWDSRKKIKYMDIFLHVLYASFIVSDKFLLYRYTCHAINIRKT